MIWKSNVFKILAEYLNNLEQMKNNLGLFSDKNEDQQASYRNCWFLNKKVYG